MNPTYTKNDTRRILKSALGETLDGPVVDDIDYLADEDFMLRWSDGTLSDQERERFLEYLNRNPSALLAVSEMVSSGLITLPPVSQKNEPDSSSSRETLRRPRRDLRIWYYYSSAVVLLIALVITARFLSSTRTQTQRPEQQIARKTDPPVEPNTQPIEMPPTKEQPTEISRVPAWPIGPNAHWVPPRNPPQPGPSPWGSPSGGYSTRSHGAGGGTSLPTFNIATSSEKSVCVIRQDEQGNEAILTSEEIVPKIVDWLIEKYHLDRTVERSKDFFLIILSENDEKMEIRHSKGCSFKTQATDLEQAQKSLNRYFDIKSSPTTPISQPR